MKKIIIISIFTIFLIWLVFSFIRGNSYYMGRKYIVNGEYELLWGDPYSSTNTLGYSINAHGKIDSLRNLKWNSEIIIMEQNTEINNRWSIIKSSIERGTLQIMQDTLIRDLTEEQIDSIINSNQYTEFHIETLKKDIVDRCYK